MPKSTFTAAVLLFLVVRLAVAEPIALGGRLSV